MLSIETADKLSASEYLEFERGSEYRHELYFGNLIEMPGNSILHNRICMLLWAMLNRLFDNENFTVVTETVKVRIPDGISFFYPDVIVSTAIRNMGSTYVIEDPLLIIEVLSDSTRKFDSTDKFIQYSKIPTLQYYLLVEPEKHLIICYERTADDWISKPYMEMSDVISLNALQVSFTLADVYKA
jgi:Uma2 family endonuclease